MKGNINKTDGSGHWWAYDAYCDKCGIHFRDQNTMAAGYPDVTEKDYCYTCLAKHIHICTKE